MTSNRFLKGCAIAGVIVFVVLLTVVTCYGVYIYQNITSGHLIREPQLIEQEYAEELLRNSYSLNSEDVHQAIEHYNAGVTYYRQEQFSKAAVEFNEAFSLAPILLTDRKAHGMDALKFVYLAHAKSQTGTVPTDWCELPMIILGPSDTTVPTLEAELAQDPTDVEALDGLAHHDTRQGNYEAALEKRLRLVELSPSFENYYFLATTYEKLQLYDEMITAYEKAFEIYPFHTPQHAYLGRFYLERGLIEKAAVHYAWANASCPDDEYESKMIEAIEALAK